MSIMERGGFGPAPGPGLRLGADFDRDLEDSAADNLEPVDHHPGRVGQWIGVLSLIFVVAALFGLVAFHARIAEHQNGLDDLEQQVTDARVENDRLRLSLAQMESPGRIVATAKGQLGMIEPIEIVYLTPPAQTLTSDEIRDAFLGRTVGATDSNETPAQ